MIQQIKISSCNVQVPIFACNTFVFRAIAELHRFLCLVQHSFANRRVEGAAAVLVQQHCIVFSLCVVAWGDGQHENHSWVATHQTMHHIDVSHVGSAKSCHLQLAFSSAACCFRVLSSLSHIVPLSHMEEQLAGISDQLSFLSATSALIIKKN